MCGWIHCPTSYLRQISSSARSSTSRPSQVTAVPTAETVAAEHRGADDRSCSRPEAAAHMAQTRPQADLRHGVSSPADGRETFSSRPDHRLDRGRGTAEPSPSLDPASVVGLVTAQTPTLSTLSSTYENHPDATLTAGCEIWGRCNQQIPRSWELVFSKRSCRPPAPSAQFRDRMPSSTFCASLRGHSAPETMLCGRTTESLCAYPYWSRLLVPASLRSLALCRRPGRLPRCRLTGAREELVPCERPHIPDALHDDVRTGVHHGLHAQLAR